MISVSGRSVHLQLSIETESDPIEGSLATGGGAPQGFCGWIELVAAIESARQVPGGPEKTLGASPGANHRGV